MPTIDGSHGEGGGQIIRTAVSLAAITGQAFEIHSIRAKRNKPGLQPQHLAAVRAAAELCGADLGGAAVGSTSLTFEPRRPVSSGCYRFDIGTAGAATLVAQTVLLPLALAGVPSEVTVIGGTYNPHAPPYEYFAGVYLPALSAMGIEAQANSSRAGFYPRGGGEIRIVVNPGAPRSIHWTERGARISVDAAVVTSGLPEEVAERGASKVGSLVPEARIAIERREALGIGAAVVVRASHAQGYAGFTSLGERGKRMERVAEEACEAFSAFATTKACVDEHLADQLVLPASLAEGASRWTAAAVTEHLETVLWLAAQFLPIQFSIDHNLVTVSGQGQR